MGTIVGGVLFYLSPMGQKIPFFGILPNYMDDADCPIYWAEVTARQCPIWDTINGIDCFPLGPESNESNLTSNESKLTVGTSTAGPNYSMGSSNLTFGVHSSSSEI